MDLTNNNVNEGMVKIRIEAVGGDLDRIACRYPASFMNEMARQLTAAIENACSIEGLADSSVELVMMFASSTYMEHISGNVTYRRLMLIDAVSAPRDFWVRWTKLGPIDGEYNEDNILFELGEDVEQKIRQTEYKYLLNSGKEKYHNSMSRKKVIEWREVIKRAARRGEIKKVESDFELAPETLELEERIADLLGKRINQNAEPKKKEVPYITPEDDDFARAMAKARLVVEAVEEDEENAECGMQNAEFVEEPVEEIADPSLDEKEIFEIEEEPSEAIAEPLPVGEVTERFVSLDEEEMLEIEEEPEIEIELIEETDEPLVIEEKTVEDSISHSESEDEPELELDIFADEEEEEPSDSAEIDIFADSEPADESDLIDEWLTENRDTAELILDEEPEESAEFIENEAELEIIEEPVEEIDEPLLVGEVSPLVTERYIPLDEEEALEIEEEPEESAEFVEDEAELEIIEESVEEIDESLLVGEVSPLVTERSIPLDEEETLEIEVEPAGAIINRTFDEEEKIPVMAAASVQSAELIEEAIAPVREQVETIADRIADIRAELEIKIRLEYESRARAKAEEELIKLRRELQRVKSESETIITELVKENEKLRMEYEHLLKQTERETIAREAELARRRVEEEQLRAQIERQLREEATERERLAEAARLAIEEQRRLEAENARIAREREEEERLEAERIRKEEEERAIEALRQAELERIRKEEAAKQAKVKNAMPTKGDGKYSYTTKTVKFLFRRSVDPNITTRIQEIIKATVDYYGKDNVYLKIKAIVPDTQTVVLEFVNIPIEEMELLGNIIKILGNSGLGIAKAIIE